GLRGGGPGGTGDRHFPQDPEIFPDPSVHGRGGGAAPGLRHSLGAAHRSSRRLSLRVESKKTTAQGGKPMTNYTPGMLKGLVDSTPSEAILVSLGQHYAQRALPEKGVDSHVAYECPRTQLMIRT